MQNALVDTILYWFHFGKGWNGMEWMDGWVGCFLQAQGKVMYVVDGEEGGREREELVLHFV